MNKNLQKITIGIPKEIKNHEYRVSATPDGVAELKSYGHEILVETKAGEAIGFSDQMYLDSGAKIISNAKEIFEQSDMIIKVKEPQAEELAMLKENQLLFTYLHLAPDPNQIKGLIDSKCVAIAYETVTDNNGKLPLLAPMSEVAGRMSIQVAMSSLQLSNGGSGTLLGGVSGVIPGKVVILGGGYVGENAARVAMGVGADVVIVDNWIPRLKELDQIYGPRLKTVKGNKAIIAKLVSKADVVIGAALVKGASAPKLVTKDMLKTMKKGSVLVDVSIDQGGCFETSKATTHDNPTYVVDDIVHYCVANMPGGVARTSTIALTNATLPFIINLANKGWEQACKDDANLKNGINVVKGYLTCKEVSDENPEFPYQNVKDFI